MKNGTRILVAALVVILVVGGGFGVRLLLSPQYALQKIVNEINEKGLSSVEPHLSSSMKEAYDTMMSLIRNPVVSLLAQTDKAAAAVAAISNETGSIKWTVKDVKESSAGTAAVTLRAEGRAFSGNLNIEMVKENGKWKIGDISIPVAGWIFQ